MFEGLGIFRSAATFGLRGACFMLAACSSDLPDERLGTLQQELTPFSAVVPFGIDEPGIQEWVVGPEGGTPVPSWRVRHDNPWLGADYTLRSSNDPAVTTAAHRPNAVSWLYEFFDIEAYFHDAGGGAYLSWIQPYRRASHAWPARTGLWQGGGRTFSWEARGILLDPLGTARGWSHGMMIGKIPSFIGISKTVTCTSIRT
jgi:hypothetical protein